MKMSEWLEKRDAVCAQLIAEGWDYDQARFATMTAGASQAGLLQDQPSGNTHSALSELAAAFLTVTDDDRVKPQSPKNTEWTVDQDDYLDYVSGKIPLSDIIPPPPQGDEYSDQPD